MAMNKSLEKFLRKKKRTGKDVINYQTIFEEELENLRRYCNGSGLVQESELIEDVTPAKNFGSIYILS